MISKQFRFTRSILFFFACLPFLLSNSTACKQTSTQNSGLEDFPPIILWAWEREENLEFLDAKKYGVAFLAQTLELKDDETIVRPRRQPFRVSPETALIAVTRIESGESPALSDKQKNEIINSVLKTLELKNVLAVQIDFDAALSQRDFYQNLLTDLRRKLPEQTSLSITALASFCIGDRWLFEAPVAEAVPMIFRMGADDSAVKNYLANGGDFKIKICQQSYGVSLDEPVQMNFDKSRRLYVFNPQPWKPADLRRIEENFNK
ncbi:MAG: DUF3142 domain-containing protein [Acidobacteriota bacterium]|nr:DUF3142 domain-containing protein [Acidobacteriota bacterium]